MVRGAVIKLNDLSIGHVMVRWRELHTSWSTFYTCRRIFQSSVSDTVNIILSCMHIKHKLGSQPYIQGIKQLSYILVSIQQTMTNVHTQIQQPHLIVYMFLVSRYMVCQEKSYFPLLLLCHGPSYITTNGSILRMASRFSTLNLSDT